MNSYDHPDDGLLSDEPNTTNFNKSNQGVNSRALVNKSLVAPANVSHMDQMEKFA